VAVVRDDNAKTVTLYVNGVQDGSVSYAGIPVLALQGDKLLGGSGPGFLRDSFSGLLDDVGLFNRALSAAEIQNIYSSANLPANRWTINGPDHGTVNGLTFSSIGNLIGGPANDTFALRSGGSLSGKLDGGAGTNALDYSAYPGDITVDLPLATATAIAKGIANIQNVTGSIGNDILVGDANPNVLKGGTGRNLIIGGAGADTITGGGGDNILVGGTTAWDKNPTALQGILHEFLQTYDTTDPVNDFNIRVNNIKKGKGTLTGTNVYLQGSHGKLAQTVFGDGVTDTLTGGGGLNWFWLDAADVSTSTNPNDRHDQV
jgi:Ca2+-binding RTX toxin-like protein